MASVSKRKWTYKGQQREAWVVRYLDKGGAHRSRQFDLKKQADAYKLEVENELSNNTHVAHAASITIAKLLDEYFEWMGEREKSGEVGPQHFLKQWTFSGRIKDHIGNIIAKELTWRDVKGMMDALRKEVSSHTGRKLSNGTLQVVLALLNSAIKMGIRRKYLARNPVEEARPEMGSFAAPAIQTFSQTEVQAIFHTLQYGRLCGRYTRFRQLRTKAIVYLAACCGLRTGEILGLGLDCIDFETGMIDVRRNLTRLDTLKGPKTAAGVRTVPMPSLVANAIREYLAVACPDQRGLIFRSENGSFIGNGNLHMAWRTTLHRAGITKDRHEHGRHFHALRHYAGSAWLEGGVPLADVSRLLGHANVQVTAEIYSHAIKPPEVRASAISACADALVVPQLAQELRNAA